MFWFTTAKASAQIFGLTGHFNIHISNQQIKIIIQNYFLEKMKKIKNNQAVTTNGPILQQSWWSGVGWQLGLTSTTTQVDFMSLESHYF